MREAFESGEDLHVSGGGVKAGRAGGNSWDLSAAEEYNWTNQRRFPTLGKSDPVLCKTFAWFAR